MGGKPKASDAAPSQAEIAQTQVAADKKQFLLNNYAPLNLAELDDALTDSVKTTARSRTNADVMQATTSTPTYRETANLSDNAGKNAATLTTALGQATAGAKDFQNKRVAASVGVAQGQSADNDKAMQTLANIGNAEVIAKAKRRREENAALVSAGVKMATAVPDKIFGDKGKWGEFRAALEEYKTPV